MNFHRWNLRASVFTKSAILTVNEDISSFQTCPPKSCSVGCPLLTFEREKNARLRNKAAGGMRGFFFRDIHFQVTSLEDIHFLLSIRSRTPSFEFLVIFDFLHKGTVESGKNVTFFNNFSASTNWFW